MALQYGKLQDITTLPSSAGAVYTNPASTKTYIRQIIIHNANTATEAVSLWNVPDSAGSLGSSGLTNKIYKQNLVADETVFIDFVGPGLTLDQTNEAIFGLATTSSKVTITFIGDKDA